MTWLAVVPDNGFGLANLPFGSFSPAGGGRRLGVAIGDDILDLAGVAGAAGSDLVELVAAPVLNPLLTAGHQAWTAARTAIREWLTDPDAATMVGPHLHPRSSATMHLPFEVGDYVDFYASEHHAANVGRIFRPGAEPLTPNWRHMPIGYHGRAGSIVVSGTDIRRPRGQRQLHPDAGPELGPSVKLDIEAEIGFVVGGSSQVGEPVPVQEFAHRVFGAFILNDWSARDIQAWEYVPLGPFLGKSFATSISPWVVPLEALQAARISPPPRHPEPLDYLRDPDDRGLDIELAVHLNGYCVSRPPFREMYWTAAQQLAHLTVNGAPARPADIYASGTVSGPEPDSWGSLLELTHDGRAPVALPDGTRRGYLADGDVVSISAWAPATDGTRLSFGRVDGRIVPAR
jgi:fumarylacetoacetase